MLAFKLKQFLVWVLLLGLGLDVYSSLGYGIITISLLASAIMAYLLYMNFFSHQTYFSLILLTAVMVVVYNLFLSLASVVFYAVGFSWIYVSIDLPWMIGLGWQLLGTCTAFIVFYVIFHPTIERFREQFMIRRH
jgi:hypothetical protein